MENNLTYNKKAFLLPGSIDSMSSYHAKIRADGMAIFRIHDCNGSVRLWNELTDPEQVEDVVDKLQTLGNAALEFAHFIRMNYTQPPNV